MNVADTVGNPTPSVSQYAAAFSAVGGLPDSYGKMLRAHYYAPNRTVTAAQLSKAVGYGTYNAANLNYGKLGRLVGEQLDWLPSERSGVLLTFKKTANEWHWTMRPEVAQALELLGWVKAVDLLPDELHEDALEDLSISEGDVRRVSVNAYERNPKARKRCIEYYGTSCCICGFNFGKKYGELAEGFIHVHHLRSLSEVGARYEVDPEDLRPVCPNCHAVLHQRTPAFSIEEVRSLLE